MKKIFTVVISVLLIPIICSYFFIAPIAYQGSAYAAKNLCSGVFVSELSAETVMSEAIIPASPLLANANYFIDKENKSVKANLFGLFSRNAQYRSQLGCTLVPKDATTLAAISLPETVNTNSAYQPSNDSVPGIDNGLLNQAVSFAFAENDPNGNKNTKAVVIMHKGRVVAERYAEGVKPDAPLLGWSMSKSITNMLLGILVKQDKLNIDEPAPVTEWKNDERSAITTNHLLQMSSGLAFNETYGMATDVTQMLTAEIDMGAFAAAKPLEYPIGSFWSYSSGTSNILARMVYQKTGATVEDSYRFMQTQLFQPLGIKSNNFEVDTSGVFVGSSYLYLSARDWAKLGQLLLQNGEWNGQQILPEGWVEYSTTPAPANPRNSYGAHFWLNQNPTDSSVMRTWPDVPENAFAMQGYQGQRVVVIPSKELVVVRLGFTPLPARPGMNEVLNQIINALN